MSELGRIVLLGTKTKNAKVVKSALNYAHL